MPSKIKKSKRKNKQTISKYNIKNVKQKVKQNVNVNVYTTKRGTNRKKTNISEPKQPQKTQQQRLNNAK